jgi:hypothetical protein
MLIRPDLAQIVLRDHPDDTVMCDAQRDGWYVAAIRGAGEDTPSRTECLREVGGHWVASATVDVPGEVVHNVGRDPSRAGGHITVTAGTRLLLERVSEGGWWTTVAAGGARLQIPGPDDGSPSKFPLF